MDKDNVVTCKRCKSGEVVHYHPAKMRGWNFSKETVPFSHKMLTDGGRTGSYQIWRADRKDLQEN